MEAELKSKSRVKREAKELERQAQIRRHSGNKLRKSLAFHDAALERIAEKKYGMNGRIVEMRIRAAKAKAQKKEFRKFAKVPSFMLPAPAVFTDREAAEFGDSGIEDRSIGKSHTPDDSLVTAIPGLLAQSVAKIEEALASKAFDHPPTLDEMQTQETIGKNRKGVHAAIERRLKVLG